eukprot:TRINITY_DN5460_c0_g1_i1.p1 TRINITY_DN5460_c0_g1~~TRINITY_DN5460_c0_g1_i1.p1  ORF type:complete len:605 (+),score=153.69 TRINITY_DN5460_c0_g1_i1:52-1815(+)
MKSAVLALAACGAAAAVSQPETLEEFTTKHQRYWDELQANSKPGPVVKLADGAVQGMIDKTGAETFWSIPFAAPPLGKLRLAPPVPPAPWDGVRAETKAPRWCPQFHLVGNQYFGHEDCLYLNVFRPSGTTEQDKLPVMVWFYGGGFVMGDSYELGWYDGKHLADTQNVVVVTLNYRLGALGFLALDSLYDAHGTAGLFGILDQQMALKWVRANIGQLGGDAGRVMIYGQSAGGVSVVAHMALPSSRGLFHAVAGESSLPGTDIMWPPRENATAWSSNWAAFIGCPQKGQAQLDCLRGKSVSEMLEPKISASWAKNFPNATPGSIPLFMPIQPWWPAIDGKVLPASPFELAAKGEIADVPLIIGTTANEGSIFLPAIPLISGDKYPITKEGFAHTMRHFFNESVSEATTKAYPVSKDFLDPLRYSRVAQEVIRDWMFACPTRRFVRLMLSAPQKRKSAVYLYHFEYRFEGILHGLAGDYHMSEISYVYGNPFVVHDWPLGTWNDDDKRLSAEMGSYWASLARGSRNAAPLTNVTCTFSDKSACITWPAYTTESDQHMAFKKGIQVDSGLYAAKCDYWDSVGYSGVHP